MTQTTFTFSAESKRYQIKQLGAISIAWILSRLIYYALFPHYRGLNHVSVWNNLGSLGIMLLIAWSWLLIYWIPRHQKIHLTLTPDILKYHHPKTPHQFAYSEIRKLIIFQTYNKRFYNLRVKIGRANFWIEGLENINLLGDQLLASINSKLTEVEYRSAFPLSPALLFGTVLGLGFLNSILDLTLGFIGDDIYSAVFSVVLVTILYKARIRFWNEKPDGLGWGFIILCGFFIVNHTSSLDLDRYPQPLWQNTCRIAAIWPQYISNDGCVNSLPGGYHLTFRREKSGEKIVLKYPEKHGYNKCKI